MHTRDLNLKVKGLSSEGSFQGIATTYNELDLVGDVILPGSYNAAIKMQPDAGYPLLWAHRPDVPVGTAKISDSRDALLVDGKLVMADPQAQVAYQHLLQGSVKGLSIGYSIPANKSTYKEGIRYISEIKLMEISLVSIPACQSAQVTAVKSIEDVTSVLRSLKAGDSDQDELLLIERELKRLLVTTSKPDYSELQNFARALQGLVA